MNFIPVKTPKLIKGIFPNYTWDMPNDQNVIYLTFDDGPTPEITNWTLELLKSYKAKATFFCIGNNIESHPEIFQDTLKDGHAIGNHTFSHLKGWTTNTEVYVNEVLKTQEIIGFQQSTNDNQQSAINKKLFRPPYGKIKSSQGKQLLNLGYKIIMWDVLAFDWKDSITKEQSAKNVISKTESGSIVVFHDSLKAAPRMQYALAKTLEHFSNEGFVFKSIPM